jgi:hypothetical protein
MKIATVTPYLRGDFPGQQILFSQSGSGIVADVASYTLAFDIAADFKMALCVFHLSTSGHLAIDQLAADPGEAWAELSIRLKSRRDPFPSCWGSTMENSAYCFDLPYRVAL